MDLASTLTEIRELTVDDRLRLVEAIWDSIAAEPERFKLTDAQKRELDRRLAAHLAHPEDADPWEKVKARTLDRARR